MSESSSNGGKSHWKARTLELEEILNLVNQALILVPIDQLEKEYDWVPSPEAVRLLRRAKGSVRSYVDAHSKLQ